MKGKIKRFFLEKRELIVFLGVLAVIFTTVITVISIAMKDANNVSGEIESEITSSTIPSSSSKGVESSKELPTTIGLPITGEYKIVREFFDSTKTSEELATAIIYTGSYYVESKGISFAREDNSSFEVNAIYPGTVKEINYDEANGYSITIDHNNGLISTYKSLSSCNVSQNDYVASSDVIGVSGSRVYDSDAGVHVHVEVKLNNSYLNLKDLIGKEIEEVVEVK